MTDVSYVPGEWTAVAGDCCWALIDAAPDSVTVREIWQRIEDGASLDMLMASLLRTGLRQAPDFALLATHDGGSYLFCRGRGSATLNTEDSPERLTGAGLVTWREHPVASNVAFVVLGDTPVGAELQLPASAGIFLARSVTIALTGASNRRAETDAARSSAVSETGSKAAEAPPPVPIAPATGDSEAGATLSYPGADDGTPGDDAVSVAPGGTAPEGTETGPQETGYDFLFGGTQVRTVEDAAVRPAPDDGQPPGPEAKLRGTRAGAAVAGKPAGTVPSGTQADAVRRAPGMSEASPSGTPPPSERLTLPPPDPATGPEDDNGATADRADLLQLASRAAASDRIGPTVHALLCPSSHPSPPGSPACRLCDVPLPRQDPVTVPRPVLGVLRLSTGDVIMLDRGVVMGRSPRTDFNGEERPHIVKLPGGDGEISRTHLQVSLDGWDVLVTDLNSTNGTLVTLPGRDPERLRPSEPFPIQPGTVVTLADDIFFRYEEPR